VLKLWIKLTPFLNRWSNSAPAVCCGVCKPCVTTAATGLVTVAATEAVAARKSGSEGSGSGAGESAGELGEDRQVSV
jgi:hypothetical protein